jgi:hypothetical protein
MFQSATDLEANPFHQSPSSPEPNSTTAPTEDSNQQTLSLTEEQKRKIEENRLKALAKRRTQVPDPIPNQSNQEPEEMYLDML